MLDALRRSPVRWISPDQMAILAIASPISGPGRTAKRAVAESDEVELDAVAGLLQAKDWRGEAAPLMADEVVGAWRAKQGGMAAEILGALFTRGDRTREEVAAELGRSPISGPWRSAWKSLRNNLLVEEAGGKRWRLASILRSLPEEPSS
jgi:hypothetical protein